ncbi:MAG: DNA-3-methyladenine glycosylase [Candidatus Thermoplasmatota archaeon]|nr:DNA-3-methyladenine glycosylase [Candidatus Thermoplasmatota archaeon]
MALKKKKLERQFYRRATEKVAEDLLGKHLVRISPEGKTVGKIVETEAYLGEEDPASHSYQGGKTERTRVMFGPPGYAYVYMIYGMYYCLNAVTGQEKEPEGVFVRALEPLEGLDLMKERRGLKDKSELTNGPGKLCMAMDIDKQLNGADLCGDKLYIARSERPENLDIKKARRINIDYAGKAKEWKLRFFIKGNPYVSKRIG